MAAPTIERPSVQVIQQFQSASPTIVRPTMPGCIMGPCFQVIEAVQDDGSLNPDAQITEPARFAFSFVSSPFEYVGIGGLTFEISVNHAAAEQVVFSTGPNLTVDEVADEINTAAIPGLKAIVEVSGADKRVVIYTDATGENASLQVGTGTSSTVLTVFGLTAGYTNVGASGYNNFWQMKIGRADFPDPRGIIDQVDIDYATIRVFINDGAGNVREVLRTETFLDGATSAVTVHDDGNGDNLSPYLDFAGGNFHKGPAVLTGTVDWSTLSYPADFGTNTLKITINGVLVTVTFANPGNAAAAIGAVNTALGVNGTAVLNGSNQPVITSALSGPSSSVEITGSDTINHTTIGLALGAYAAGKQSIARARGTVDVSGLTYATDVQGRTLRMLIDGDQYQTIVFSTSVVSAATLVTAINNLWGAGTASLDASSHLVLHSHSTFGGAESEIRIDKNASDATLLTNLGLTTSGAPFELVSVVNGNAYAPAVGDEVWVDGIRLGEIVEIPVTPTNRLRISVQQLLTFTGSTWFLQAKGLDNSTASATRPSSDLLVDLNTGFTRVKHDLFRDTAGVPSMAGPLATYLGYTALRKDVSPAGTDFNLLRFGSTTDLEAALAPLDTQNPLGLGMYFGILNCPGIELTGLGVDDTSVSEPDGTLAAYTRAFEYLESKDVYGIAPLTHSNDVGQVAQLHVDTLSLPENGLERIAILNPKRPTRKSNTLVASAAAANVAGAPTDTVQTGIANLQALLAAAGKPGPTYTENDGVFLLFEDDTNLYLVQSVSGAVVTVNNGPLSSGSPFFDGGGSPVFTSAIVDRPVSVFILGGTLGNRTEEATAYGEIAQGYKDRRVIATAPDTAKATIGGLEQAIDGFYLAAALAGKFSAVSPSQPLTEESIAGFTGVIGSQDRYSELQLKILSGSGLWVLYQEADGQPVKTRHQLTTDMSTIEKRETSITRALDFTAKFLRNGLRNFIGRFNITTNVQDAISVTLDGLTAFLIRQGVLKSLSVNAIRQSASAPDTLEIDITVGVLYPLNYIKITLVI